MRPGMVLLAAVILPLCPAAAEESKLTTEDRIELLRGLTAELATAKVVLPRSKKPLLFSSDGSYDKQQWTDIGREFGPAARVGDLVKLTKVSFEEDRILFEINGGMKGGRKWYEGIQVGVGTRTAPISGGGYSVAPSGTSLALLFAGRVPPIKAAEVKKLLAPILDFNFRSATEQYVEALPPEIRKAVKEKKAVEGMDKDQVLLALGRPRHKVREVKDGVELEDWVYGEPPGKITFVTFDGNKVIQVKETYAGLGDTAPRLPSPR